MRLLDLGSVVQDVAENHGPLSAGIDHDAHVPRSVAGSGESGKFAGDAEFTFHPFHQVHFSDGPHAFRGVGEAVGLQRRVLAGFIVNLAKIVAGVGEGWHQLAALVAYRVPAHMVAVQVSHHDGVDVAWR